MAELLCKVFVDILCRLADNCSMGCPFGSLSGASKARSDLIQANIGSAIVSIRTAPDKQGVAYLIRRSYRQPPTLSTADGKPIAEVDLDRGVGERIRPSGGKKILMGRFLLDRGVGRSRPTFFKLAPSDSAETVAREAPTLEQKLSHIKVRGDLIAGDRSLLVTQKVGDSDEPPSSLAMSLEKPPDKVKQALKRATPSIYALMVFDCAMLQLGGLARRSGSKIAYPPNAALLASLTANWLRRVAPEFFGGQEDPS